MKNEWGNRTQKEIIKKIDSASSCCICALFFLPFFFLLWIACSLTLSLSPFHLVIVVNFFVFFFFCLRIINKNSKSYHLPTFLVQSFSFTEFYILVMRIKFTDTLIQTGKIVWKMIIFSLFNLWEVNWTYGGKKKTWIHCAINLVGERMSGLESDKYYCLSS